MLLYYLVYMMLLSTLGKYSIREAGWHTGKSTGLEVRRSQVQSLLSMTSKDLHVLIWKVDPLISKVSSSSETVGSARAQRHGKVDHVLDFLIGQATMCLTLNHQRQI